MAACARIAGFAALALQLCVLITTVCGTSASAAPPRPSFLDTYTASGGTHGFRIFYDGPGHRYREDVIAYGTDTTINLFYCDTDGALVSYSLSYPGQPSGPFNPKEPQYCTTSRRDNSSCSDMFGDRFTVPEFKSPFTFNPLYLPLAAPIRRGIPDDFEFAGATGCPSGESQLRGHSAHCQMWNFTEAVPACDNTYTSQYVVNAAQRFPVRYSWNPIFKSKESGMCESYEDSSVYYLVSSSAPASQYIEGFAAQIPASKCHQT